MGKQEPETIESVTYDQLSGSRYLRLDSHASRLLIYTTYNLLLQLWIFSNKLRQSTICVDFMLQVCLHVGAAGPDVDLRYIGKLCVKVHMWTRRDEYSDQALYSLDQTEKLFPARFRACVLSRMNITLRTVKEGQSEKGVLPRHR